MITETTFTARVKRLRERYSPGAAIVAPVEVGEGGVSRGAGAMGRGAVTGGGGTRLMDRGAGFTDQGP